MKIYANGCSFTYGDELSEPSDSAWPAQLATRLQATVTNDAISGGTNARTVYRTVKHLQDKYDLYIVAWTTNTRFTFYHANNNHDVNFNPMLLNDLYGHESYYQEWGQILYRYWYNELYAFKLWLQQIIQLQSILEQQKKQYLMVNTMGNNLSRWIAPKDQFIESVKSLINFDSLNDEQIFDEYKEIQYYASLINKDMFYKWDTFVIQQLNLNFKRGPGGHFLEEGHAHLSELLYQHLCLK